jgi:hypothetical protein
MRPIFICGAPRSGTTIIHNILNLHPKVIISNEWGIGELVSDMHKWINSRAWVPKSSAYDMLSFLYQHSFCKPTAMFFGDKHPGGYCYYEILKQHFPWMVFIETIRNPYEEIASGLARNDNNWHIAVDHHLEIIKDSFDMHIKIEEDGFHVIDQ